MAQSYGDYGFNLRTVVSYTKNLKQVNDKFFWKDEERNLFGKIKTEAGFYYKSFIGMGFVDEKVNPLFDYSSRDSYVDYDKKVVFFKPFLIITLVDGSKTRIYFNSNEEIDAWIENVLDRELNFCHN